MAEPTQDQITQVQDKTVEIQKRLKSDAGFKSQYQADPAATLKAQGLPDDAVNELLGKAAKASGKGEVSGYDYTIDTYYADHTMRRRWYTDYGTEYMYEDFYW